MLGLREMYRGDATISLKQAMLETSTSKAFFILLFSINPNALAGNNRIEIFIKLKNFVRIIKIENAKIKISKARYVYLLKIVRV